MHIHHIHALIQYARLLAGSLRFFGAIAFMLLFSLLELAGAASASALPEMQSDRRITLAAGRAGGAENVLAAPDPFADKKYAGVKQACPAPPDAIGQGSHTCVYERLQPGIVLIPRMNRTPKPKSVYRLFARAPGEEHLLV